MIVELFGAAGSGKTTFANALARQLRTAGQRVEAVMSSRPAESGSLSRPHEGWRKVLALPRRFARPIAEMGLVWRDQSGQGRPWAELLALDPPVGLVTRLRMQQYLMRLTHAWSRASIAGHIVLFDQGFVQAVCTLLLVGRLAADQPLLEKLISTIPKSDVMIHVRTPRAVVEQRLRQRLRRQGPMERLLEADLEANLDSIAVIDRLDEALKRSGRTVINALSLDQSSLTESLTSIQLSLIDRPSGAGLSHPSISTGAWH